MHNVDTPRNASCVYFYETIKSNIMTQQTAVEWFASEVLDYTTLIPMRIIKKAKEMQKQQTIEFAEQYNSYLIRCSRGIRGSVVEMDAEQYYNEIFNK